MAEIPLEPAVASERQAGIEDAEVEQLAATFAAQEVLADENQAFYDRHRDSGVLGQSFKDLLELHEWGDKNGEPGFIDEILKCFIDDMDTSMVLAAAWLERLPGAGPKVYDDFRLRVPVVNMVESCIGRTPLRNTLWVLRTCKHEYDETRCREAFLQAEIEYAELKGVLNEFLDARREDAGTSYRQLLRREIHGVTRKPSLTAFQPL